MAKSTKAQALPLPAEQLIPLSCRDFLVGAKFHFPTAAQKGGEAG